jgi:hypothetical protein
VAINTGGDMTMQGANVRGGQVTTNVGGNLNIESRADTSNNSSTSVGAYVGGSGLNRDSAGRGGQYGGEIRTGASGNLEVQNSDSTRVRQLSGIVGGDGSVVNVLTGNTTLTAGVIGTDSGNIALNTRSLTQNSLTESSSQSSLSGSLAGRVDQQGTPEGSRSSTSTSSIANSSVGAPGQQIQATLNVAQVSQVLNQPAVQTALLLNKGMKAALAQYGSSESVPVATMRTILTSAGVAAPANVNSEGLKALFNSAVESGYTAASTQLSKTNIPQVQIDGILKAINP